MKAELASMSSPVRKIEQQLIVQLDCKEKKKKSSIYASFARN